MHTKFFDDFLFCVKAGSTLRPHILWTDSDILHCVLLPLKCHWICLPKRCLIVQHCWNACLTGELNEDSLFFDKVKVKEKVDFLLQTSSRAAFKSLHSSSDWMLWWSVRNQTFQLTELFGTWWSCSEVHVTTILSESARNSLASLERGSPTWKCCWRKKKIHWKVLFKVDKTNPFTRGSSD